MFCTDKWDEAVGVLNLLITQRFTTVLPGRNVTGATCFFSTLAVMNFSIVLDNFNLYGIFHIFSYSGHTNVEIIRPIKFTQNPTFDILPSTFFVTVFFRCLII